MIYTFHANPVRYVIDLWAPPGDGTQPRVIKLQIQLRWDPLDSYPRLNTYNIKMHSHGIITVQLNYYYILYYSNFNILETLNIVF